MLHVREGTSLCAKPSHAFLRALRPCAYVPSSGTSSEEEMKNPSGGTIGKKNITVSASLNLIHCVIIMEIATHITVLF